MTLAERVALRHLQSAKPGPYKIGPEPTDKEIKEMQSRQAAEERVAKGGENATWAKLRDGSWGVRVPHSAKPGEQVTVQKKNGQTSRIYLGRQVWTDRKSVWLFTVGGNEASSSGGSGSGGRSHPRGRRYECEECGEYVMPGTTCWETGASH